MRLFLQTVFLSIMVIFTVAGCSDRSSYELRVATNVWPGYEPLYLAKELGAYGDETVDLVEMPNATEVIRSYRNGIVDAAAVTLDEALLLAQYHNDFSIILIMDFSHGGDVIMARSPIDSLEKLKGKKVGLENTALGSYVLSRALEIASIDPKELTAVPVTVDEQEEFYKRGRVDAVVTFEPVRSKLLNAGAKQVFDSSLIPGEIVDVLIVRNKVLNKHPKAVKGLLKGWFTALSKLNNEPEQSSRIISSRLGITPKEVLESYNGLLLPDIKKNKEMLFGEEPQLLKSLSTLQRVMYKNKILSKKTDIKLFLPAEEKISLYP